MKKVLAAALSLGLIESTWPAPLQANDDSGGHTKIKHVLLNSIDGMHVVDYLNSSKGQSGVNGGAPYCPNLAELSENGVSYRDTSTSSWAVDNSQNYVWEAKSPGITYPGLREEEQS
jgi:hypothetical protein